MYVRYICTVQVPYEYRYTSTEYIPYLVQVPNTVLVLSTVIQLPVGTYSVLVLNTVYSTRLYWHVMTSELFAVDTHTGILVLVRPTSTGSRREKYESYEFPY